jgi:acyl carrier protein
MEIDTTKGGQMSVNVKLKELICEQLGVDEDRVKTEASFIDDLGADSLDIVELIMTMEEKFGLEIPDDDAEKLRTVGDVVTYLKSKGKLD